MISDVRNKPIKAMLEGERIELMEEYNGTRYNVETTICEITSHRSSWSPKCC
jgi:hypothetical protein